jgi:hypothetical protein
VKALNTSTCRQFCRPAEKETREMEAHFSEQTDNTTMAWAGRDTQPSAAMTGKLALR